jgi:hypothetical protein
VKKSYSPFGSKKNWGPGTNDANGPTNGAEANGGGANGGASYMQDLSSAEPPVLKSYLPQGNTEAASVSADVKKSYSPFGNSKPTGNKSSEGSYLDAL